MSRPTTFHFFPQLAPRNIEFIRQNLELEEKQIYADIKYIAEVG